MPPAAEVQPLLPTADPKSIRDATREVRMGFVRKVYGILTAQLLLTVAIAAPLQMVATEWLQTHAWLLYVSVGMLLVSMCVMLCCSQALRTFPTNYIFLLVFTSVEAVVIGFASAQYTPQSVLLAAGVTVLIFAAMTAYAWTTKTDFTGFGPYLFAALMVLCAFGFVLSILGYLDVYLQPLVMLYDILGVLLFTFYIVFDTQMILGEWGGHQVQFGIDDYVFASLNLYLDIINLFLHLLRLFGNRR